MGHFNERCLVCLRTDCEGVEPNVATLGAAILAEERGFEPPDRLPGQRLSRAPLSAPQPLLLNILPKKDLFVDLNNEILYDN